MSIHFSGYDQYHGENYIGGMNFQNADRIASSSVTKDNKYQEIGLVISQNKDIFLLTDSPKQEETNHSINNIDGTNHMKGGQHLTWLKKQGFANWIYSKEKGYIVRKHNPDNLTSPYVGNLINSLNEVT